MLANQGLEVACRASKPLARGVNVMAGKVTNKPVAESHGLPYTHLSDLIERVDPSI
jgi:alanine dehydrogenase